MNFNESNLPLLESSPNAANLGTQYERLLISHLAIACSLRQEVTDFQLAFNAKQHGNLDDAVLHAHFFNGPPQVFLCQLKHKLHRKHVDDFLNLEKYEDTYNKVLEKYTTDKNVKVIVVLFTNALKTHPEDVIAEEVELEEKHFLSIFNTNKVKGKCYKLGKNGSESGFYNNCYLFCNQIDAKNGDILISNDLMNSVTPKQIESINNYFAKSLAKRRDPYTKTETIYILRDIILNSSIMPPGHYKPIQDGELMLQTFNQFNFSRISQENSGYLLGQITSSLETNLKMNLSQTDWDVSLSHKDVCALRDHATLKNLVRFKLNYAELTKKDLWLFLWTSRVIPLVVNCDQTNKKQVNFFLNHLSSGVSIVLVDKENLSRCNSGSEFKNLSDVPKNFLNEIIAKTKITFQMRCVTLQELLKINEDILQSIKPDGILKLFCENIKITSVQEKVPYYIKRQIQTAAYNKSIVEGSSFVSIVDDNVRLPSLKNYMHGVHQNLKKFFCDSSPKITTEIAETKIKNQSYCCFQNVQDRYVCYTCSNAKLMSFIHYKEEIVLNENELLECRHPFRVIHGLAGIGKTTFLKNLAMISTDDIYVYFNISDHIKIIRSGILLENIENFLKYLSETLNASQQPCLSPLIHKILIGYLNQNRLYLMCDGFDECNIDPYIFTRLSKQFNIPLMIATRSGRIQELKIRFYATSFEIMEFNQQDQREYFMNTMPNDEADMIIQTIVAKFSANPTINFLGIPLLVKLLCEVYQELNDNIEQTHVGILFEKFIDKQMKEFKYRFIKRFYKKLAISVFFEQQCLEQLGIHLGDFNEDFEDFKKYNKKDAIVSTINLTDNIQFIHRTYAEFLCAQHLVEVFVSSKDVTFFGNILELLFAEELIQVRLFFDLLLAKNKPLFVAVLQNNYVDVMTILKKGTECLLDTDALGRTIFHIIMGYGVRYNYPYKVAGLKNIRGFGEYNSIKQDGQFAIDSSILIALLEANDGVMQMDLFENYPTTYGFYSRSFQLLDVYSYYCDISDLPDINVNLFYVYLIVHHNFINLFRVCLKLPSIKKFSFREFNNFNTIESALRKYETNFKDYEFNAIKTLIPYFNYTILHLASDKNLVDMAEEIIRNELVSIDHRMEDQTTPLGRALQQKSVDVIQLLLDYGALPENCGESEETINKKLGAMDCNNRFVKFPECLTKKRLSELLANEQINVNVTVRSSSPVYKAVIDCNLKNLKLLFQYGAEVKTVYEDGRKIIHYAAEHSTPEIIEYLIQIGCSIEDCCQDQSTPLFWAIFGKNLKAVKYLISQKVNLNKMIGPDKTNVMHWAAQQGNSKIMQVLLEEGFNLEDCDEDGFSPLFHAILGKNSETLKYLLARGANTKHRIFQDYGPLHYAARVGNSDIVRILIDDGGCSLEGCDDALETPLIYGITENNVDTVKYLINRGANLHHLIPPHNKSVEHCAAQYAGPEILEVLLEQGCNFENIDNNQWKPLFYAVSENNVEAASYLLSKRVDLNHTISPVNLTVMHLAAQFGSSKLIEILIEANCHVDIFDYNCLTPLCYAIYESNIEAVAYLVQQKINLGHVIPPYNTTLLQYAVLRGNLDIIQLLLMKGCNLEERDDNGLTSIFIGISTKNIETVRYLESAKASLKCTILPNDIGVLHWAAQHSNTEIVEFLLQKGCGLEDYDNDKLTPLFYAILGKNIKTLNYLISKGANLGHRKLNNQQGVMHYAAQKANPEVIRILLAKGCDLEDRDNKKITPIFYAIRGHNDKVVEYLMSLGVNMKHVIHHTAQLGSKTIMKILLKAGLNLEEYNDNHQTPLLCAILGKNTKIVELLLKENVNLNIRLPPDDSGVLHYAAQLGNRLIIQYLVNAGLNLEDCDKKKLTPLYYAVRKRNVETLKVLISRGANLNHRIPPFNMGVMHYAAANANFIVMEVLRQNRCSLNDLDDNEWTPLFHAIFKKNIDAVKYLISNKANFKHKVSPSNMSPLHFAVENNSNKDIIKILIAQENSLEASDDNNWTPIYYAIRRQNTDLTEYLIQNKVNLRHKVTPNNMSVLHYAAEVSSPEIMELLLNKGCNIEEHDAYKLTPLFSSIYGNNTDTAKYLIKLKANLHHTIPPDNITVMHYAAEKGNPEILKILMNKGFSLKINDINRVTPLFYAVAANNRATIQFLMENGANLNVTDKFGRNLAHILAIKASLPTAELFTNKIKHLMNKENKENETPLEYCIKNRADGNSKNELMDWLRSNGSPVPKIQFKKLSKRLGLGIAYCEYR